MQFTTNNWQTFGGRPTYRHVRGRRRTGWDGKLRFRFLIERSSLLFILYLLVILSVLSTALFFPTVDKQLNGETLSLTSDDKEPKRKLKTRQDWTADIVDAAYLFAIRPVTSTVPSSVPINKVDGVEEHLRGGVKNGKPYRKIDGGILSLTSDDKEPKRMLKTQQDRTADRALTNKVDGVQEHVRGGVINGGKSNRKTEGFVEHNSATSEICPEFEIPHLVGALKAVDMKDIALEQVEQNLLGSHFGNVSELLVKSNKIISKLDRTNMTKQEDSSTYCVEIKGTIKCQQLFPGATVSRGLSISNYTYMPGGHWKPKDCLPRWKVAVIIPYRDRSFHLPIVLEYLTPLMQRQRLEFGFFVVEQANKLNFNRAMLMNVGFLESLNVTKWDCFIFHDVDHIPLDDNNYYGCSGMPKHFMSGSDRWKYKIPYNTFFGAVTGFSRGQMYDINGFPNVYWGWGGEDDEIFKRTKAAGYAIARSSKTVGRYNVIKHHHQSAPKANDRFDLLKDFRPRQEKDGLTNLKYSKPIITMNALYTNISVDIQKLAVTWPETVKKGKNKVKPQAQPAQKTKPNIQPNVQPVNTKGQPNVHRVNAKRKPNIQPVITRNGQPVNTKEKPNVQPAPVQGKPSVQFVNTKGKPNIQPVNTKGKPNVQPVITRNGQPVNTHEKSNVQPVQGKPNVQPANKKPETKQNVQPANANTKDIPAVNRVTIPSKPVNTKGFPLGKPNVQPDNKKPETKSNVLPANTKTKETAAVTPPIEIQQKNLSHTNQTIIPVQKGKPHGIPVVKRNSVQSNKWEAIARNDAIAKAKAQMKAKADKRQQRG